MLYHRNTLLAALPAGERARSGGGYDAHRNGLTLSFAALVAALGTSSPVIAQVQLDGYQTSAKQALCVTTDGMLATGDEDCGGFIVVKSPDAIVIGPNGQDTVLNAIDGSATFNGAAIFNGSTIVTGNAAIQSINSNSVDIADSLTTRSLVANGPATFNGAISAKGIQALSVNSVSATLGNSTLFGSVNALANTTITLGDNRIRNVGGPVDATDAATKGYVDGTLQGVQSGVTNLTTQITSQGTRLTTVEAVNTQQDAHLASIDATNAVQDGRLTATETVNNQQETRLTAMDATNVTQNNRLTATETVNGQQDSHLARIDTLDVTQDERLAQGEAVNTQQNDRLATNDALNLTQNGRLSSVEDLNTRQETHLAAIDGVDVQQNNRLGAGEAADVVQNNRLTATEAINAQQSAAIGDLQDQTRDLRSDVAGLHSDIRRANGGIAAAVALGGTMMVPDSRASISFNLATYRGEQAFSGAIVGAISPKIYVQAGFAGSTVKGSTTGRVGIAFGL